MKNILYFRSIDCELAVGEMMSTRFSDYMISEVKITWNQVVSSVEQKKYGYHAMKQNNIINKDKILSLACCLWHMGCTVFYVFGIPVFDFGGVQMDYKFNFHDNYFLSNWVSCSSFMLYLSGQLEALIMNCTYGLVTCPLLTGHCECWPFIIHWWCKNLSLY